MPDFEDIQEGILAFLRTNLVQEVHEVGVPDITTLPRDENNKVIPYYAIQFGDIQQGRGRNMAGPRGDDYQLPFYTQAIAANASISRRMANRLNLLLIGEESEYSGSIRKRPGGGMFSVNNTNGATEAYMSPASFGVLIQLEVPD